MLPGAPPSQSATLKNKPKDREAANMPKSISDLMQLAASRFRIEKEENKVQRTNQITGTRRWWALGAVLLTMFFSALDQTIISTAMPVIIGELQGFSLYAWTFTAYMMTSAITVPIYGKLSDVYGRKPFYALGLILFMLGSMLSGMVVSMPQLILARALQGLGAGAMLSMPRATIGDIFNPRERGRWMGVIASVGLAIQMILIAQTRIGALLVNLMK